LSFKSIGPQILELVEVKNPLSASTCTIKTHRLYCTSCDVTNYRMQSKMKATHRQSTTKGKAKQARLETEFIT